MIEYRLTSSRKPTLKLWRVEEKNKKLLAKTSKNKATLIKEIVLRNIPMNIMMKFRDGREIHKLEEEQALKTMIAIKGIVNLRKRENIMKLLEAIERMDRGEVYWWYSLYLRIGAKAIKALRTTYLP